jgi:hypothetical protein
VHCASFTQSPIWSNPEAWWVDAVFDDLVPYSVDPRRYYPMLLRNAPVRHSGPMLSANAVLSWMSIRPSFVSV